MGTCDAVIFSWGTFGTYWLEEYRHQNILNCNLDVFGDLCLLHLGTPPQSTRFPAISWELMVQIMVLLLERLMEAQVPQGCKSGGADLEGT